MLRNLLRIADSPSFCCRMDIAGLRTAYNEKSNVLDERQIQTDPFKWFDEWFQRAKSDPAVIEPNAMCLSTATKEGVPSARFVLCKGYGPDGFRFFTHYTSRKGLEMAENPNVALTFFWPPLSRSVRVEGAVEKLPMSEADAYFSGRPYDSQIGALCSDQSKPVRNRDVLTDKEKELKDKYKPGEVPKPEQWGGYIVKPRTLEFWQGQTDRIHDRIKFFGPGVPIDCDEGFVHKGSDGWSFCRLAP